MATESDLRSSCSSQAEEECLRPSLIRRKFHPFSDTTNLHIPSTAHCSPLQDIQALASPVPSFSGRTDHACFSPTAETNLFGSPAPSVCTPVSRHQRFARHSVAAQSPSLQQLQKQHMACLRSLNDFKAYQLEMEAHLQDKAFLTKCLKQLQDDGDDCLLPPDACTPRQQEQHTQTGPWQCDSTAYVQQAVSPDKEKELWQQLSFASSEDDDSQRIENLHAELADCKQQLGIRTAAAARLQTQISALQTELETSAQQLLTVEREKFQLAQTAAMTESSAMDQLDSLQQQHQQALQSLQNAEAQTASLQQQHQQDEKSLQGTDAHAESIWKEQLTEAHAQYQQLAKQLQLSELQHEEAMQELQTHSAETESDLLDQLQEALQGNQQIAGLRQQVQRLEQEKADASDMAASTESALMDDLDVAKQLHHEAMQQMEGSLSEAQASLAQQVHHAELLTEEASALRAQLQQAAQDKAEAAQKAANTESALTDQLDILQQQHQQALASLHSNQAQTEHLSQEANALHAQLQQAAKDKANIAQEAASTESALMDKLDTLQHQHQQTVASLQSSHMQKEFALQEQLLLLQSQSALHAEQAEQDAQTRLESQDRAERVLREQLARSQQELAEVTAQLKASQAAQAKSENTMPLLPPQASANILSQEDFLTAQQELVILKEQLALSQAAQDDLVRELKRSGQANAELADSHTLTEGTLLEQLQDAQAEQQQLQIRAQHLEDRHSEINRQLIFARSSQAQAGRTEDGLRQQLSQAQQDIHRLLESDAEAIKVPASHAELVSTAGKLQAAITRIAELEQQVQQSVAQTLSQQQLLTQTEAKLRKYKACYRDVKKQLETAKAQAATAGVHKRQSHVELEQHLAVTQSQLAEQLETASAQKQEQLAAQSSLESARTQIEQLQLELKTLQSQLTDFNSMSKQVEQLQLEINTLQSQVTNNDNAHKQVEQLQTETKALQSQLVNSDALLHDSRAETAAVTEQLAVAQQGVASLQLQLAQSEGIVKHIGLELETAKCSVSESEQQLSQLQMQNSALQTKLTTITQQLTDSQHAQKQRLQDLQHLQSSQEEQQEEISALQTKRAEVLQQVEDSQNAQSQLAQKLKLQVQQASELLQSEQQSCAELTAELAQTQHAQQAAAAELQDLHVAHSELVSKAGESSLLIQELHVHLSAAQAHMLSQQARLQAHEHEAEAVTGDLQRASRSLAHVLHQQDTSFPSAGPSVSGLQAVTEQVCGLAEGLLLHHAMLQTLSAPTLGSSKPQHMRAPKLMGKPEDSLSSHVAAAQARANHIVEEFESMLLVTGGHSLREIEVIQSQAGLGETDLVTCIHNPVQPQCKTPNSSRLPRAPPSAPVRADTTQRATQDCGCGPSSSDDSLGVSMMHSVGSASRVVTKSGGSKSKLKALKENRAPSLTYVTGSQVRGGRRPHTTVSRQPLKPSLKDSTATAVDQVSLRGPTTAQPAYTSKPRKNTSALL